MKLLIFILCLELAACTSVGVGGTVSGGSSGHIDVGAGVNIQLYAEPITEK